MALTVKKSQEVYEYIPVIERESENPFKVKIRRLTPKEFSFIEDKMTRINKDESISFTTGTFNWEVVKKGLVDWENLFDENGNPVKIVKDSSGEVSDQSLNNLPIDIINEIANVIIGITRDPDNAEIYLGTDTTEK